MTGLQRFAGFDTDLTATFDEDESGHLKDTGLQTNRANVKISHAISDASSLARILEIHSSNTEWFNLINYSVLLNVLSGMNSADPKKKPKPASRSNSGYDRNLDLNKKDGPGGETRGPVAFASQQQRFLGKEEFEFLLQSLTKRL